MSCAWNAGRPGIADHLPEHLAAIAAVDRIGEAGLHEQRIDEFVNQSASGRRVVGHLAGGDVLQECVGVRGRELIERLAEARLRGAARRSDPALKNSAGLSGS